jgi:predicted RNA-binding Zn ribbon-like protein
MNQNCSYEAELKLESGWLGLDFANTVSWHASDHPQEHLSTFADLVAWAERIRLLGPAAAQALLAQASQRPAEAEAVLAGAVELREAVYRLFVAVSRGQPGDPADLALLNAAYSAGAGRAYLAPQDGHYCLRWPAGAVALDQVLWPVAHAAASLLAQTDVLERVGVCADETGCGWLFVDTSKNRSRRWCSMGDCGNRAKARRYSARHKASEQ